MKIVVDSMPDCPSDCLFCDDVYRETCQFYGEVCVLADYSDIIKEENRICPCLIELKELKS